jgi:arylsulfatase A-like enzyme
VLPGDFTPRFGPERLDFPILWGKFPRDKVDMVKDRYADSLFYEDMQIARLVGSLRQRGLWDNTIVIIGGDNGEAFYEHGFAAHASSLFNEVMKVPMIVRGPGIEAGQDDRPAMFLDVPPSILELLGLPPHPGFQGISLFGPPNPGRSLYMMVQTPLAEEIAIVRSGFKLLFSQRGSQFFLYDQVRDPGEQRDMISERLDLLADLAPRLIAWQEEQLNYYADRARHAREYPPVLED